MRTIEDRTQSEFNEDDFDMGVISKRYKTCCFCSEVIAVLFSFVILIFVIFFQSTTFNIFGYFHIKYPGSILIYFTNFMNLYVRLAILRENRAGSKLEQFLLKF